MTLLLSSGSPSYCIWPPPAILASSCSDACTSMSPPPATLHSAFRRTHPKALISHRQLRSDLLFLPLLWAGWNTACHATIQVVYFQLGCVDISWSSHAKVDFARFQLLIEVYCAASGNTDIQFVGFKRLLAINSPPPTALISFSSRELVFISHTVGWRLSP